MQTSEIVDPYNLEVFKTQAGKLGYQSYYTPETATTMDLAEAYLQARETLPAVFLTDHQKRGIGREGRTWIDKPGSSILFTATLGIKPATISAFADLVSLNACKIAAFLTGIEGMRVKYPNDLVIDGRKTGGILILNTYNHDQYLGTSVGIGINAHYSEQELAQYPTDYGATALDLHTPQMNPRQPILVAALDKLRFLSVDAEIFQTNTQFQQDQNNLWRDCSSVYRRKVQVESGDTLLVSGEVVDTQIGKGILVENTFAGKWFNQFDTKMKVRLLD